MIAYKFLRPDGTSVFTSFRWPLPGQAEGSRRPLLGRFRRSRSPGSWVDAAVDPCRSGVHACRVEHLPYWAGQVLYEIELEGEVVEEPTKMVAARGRLVRRIKSWDKLRDTYTRMCADRAHELARSVTPPLDTFEEVVEPSIPEGPALLGFVAARIAEEVSGVEAYHAERARQAAWLAERLGLQA